MSERKDTPEPLYFGPLDEADSLFVELETERAESARLRAELAEREGEIKRLSDSLNSAIEENLEIHQYIVGERHKVAELDATIDRLLGGPKAGMALDHSISEALFRLGHTYEEIGKAFGVSKQAIKQALARRGVTKADGGYAIRPRKPRQRTRAERGAALYGISETKYLELCSHSPSIFRAFRTQRRNAKLRAIEWAFDGFSDWLAVWEASGKLEQRGRTKEGFVMARHGDAGPYAAWNVKIITLSANSSEGVGAFNKAKKIRPGVAKQP